MRAFTGRAENPAGYFESALLFGLLQAGEYAGTTDLYELEVHLFPIPGVKFSFDPFHYHEHEVAKLTAIKEETNEHDRRDDQLEQRVDRLESNSTNQSEQAGESTQPGATLPAN